MGRLLIWISGASPGILKDFPGDRAKYVGIGAAILITSSIAVVSMTFALATALKAPLWAAIPFALGWGLAILSLDRWLVVSLQRQAHWWGYLTLVLPRVLLGVLFGLIISTPFVLQIFAPEISRQITVIQTQRSNAYFAQVSSDPLTKRIENEQAAVNSFQNTINSGGGPVVDPYTQPVVAGLEKQLAQDVNKENSDFRQYKCELGGETGVCQAGDGPLAQADYLRYLQDKAQVSQDNSNISAQVPSILANNRVQRAQAKLDASAKLPAAQAALQADRRTQAALVNSFSVNNNSSAGLLLRLQALDEATSGNRALSGARTLLWLFFTVIECLPIAVKVLLLLGPENAYERAVALDERTRLRAAKEEALQRQAARIQAADIARQEEDRLQSEREARLPSVAKAAIDAEQEIAMESIRAWKSRQLSDIGYGGQRQSSTSERAPAEGTGTPTGGFRPYVSPSSTGDPGTDPGPDEHATAWVGQSGPPGQAPPA